MTTMAEFGDHIERIGEQIRAAYSIPPATLTAAARTLIERGFLTRNEAREMMVLPPPPEFIPLERGRCSYCRSLLTAPRCSWCGAPA